MRNWGCYKGCAQIWIPKLFVEFNLPFTLTSLIKFLAAQSKLEHEAVGYGLIACKSLWKTTSELYLNKTVKVALCKHLLCSLKASVYKSTAEMIYLNMMVVLSFLRTVLFLMCIAWVLHHVLFSKFVFQLVHANSYNHSALFHGEVVQQTAMTWNCIPHQMMHMKDSNSHIGVISPAARATQL